jgi:hypothetical protein
LSNFKCSYHPEIDAIDKCQKCNTAICLDCKKSFVDHHLVRLKVCPVCYYDLQVKYISASARTNRFIGILFLGTVLFSSLFFFLPLTLDIEGGGIGVIFALLVSLTPAVLLFFLTYKTFFKDPVTVEDMLAKKADFLSSLSPSSSKSSGFCSYCDEEIELGDRFCPSCGRGRTLS